MKKKIFLVSGLWAAVFALLLSACPSENNTPSPPVMPPAAPTSLRVGEATFEGYMPTTVTIPLSAEAEAGATIKYMDGSNVITVEGGKYKTKLGTETQGASSKDFEFKAKAVKDGLESAEARNSVPATTNVTDPRSPREQIDAWLRSSGRQNTNEEFPPVPFPNEFIEIILDAFINQAKTNAEIIQDLNGIGITKAMPKDKQNKCRGDGHFFPTAGLTDTSLV